MFYVLCPIFYVLCLCYHVACHPQFDGGQGVCGHARGPPCLVVLVGGSENAVHTAWSGAGEKRGGCGGVCVRRRGGGAKEEGRGGRSEGV